MNDPFSLAMDVASGREASGADLSPDVVAWAKRVVEAGRRVVAEPVCPSAVLQRAVDIPHSSSRSVAKPLAERIWSILFDSSTVALPALRGGTRTRMLRCGGDEGSIDLELREIEAGGLSLYGTVDARGEGLLLDVESEGERRQCVPIRAGGLFEATIPSSRGRFTLTLRAGRRVLARTPPLPP